MPIPSLAPISFAFTNHSAVMPSILKTEYVQPTHLFWQWSLLMTRKQKPRNMEFYSFVVVGGDAEEHAIIFFFSEVWKDSI